MQARDVYVAFDHVDSCDLSAQTRHGLAEDAAATADVEDAQVGKWFLKP